MVGLSKTKSEVRGAAGLLRPVVVSLMVVSGVVNVLALTGSFYMLQVYDRVLTSRSVPSLVALSLLAVILFLFQGGLEVIRWQMLVRLAGRLDRKLTPRRTGAVMRLRSVAGAQGNAAPAAPRRRLDPRLPVRAGTGRDPRHAVDAAVRGLRLHPAPGARLDDGCGRCCS